MITTHRKSFTAADKIYFWTEKIHNWYPLLQNDAEKDNMISSLEALSNKGVITIFAFVIIPNHIHLLSILNNLFKLFDGD
ncbi:MAG: hypothetical protein ABJA37_09410 [Ferruginibacter sp.]